MSISFDRVANIYDATRGLPPQVSEQITDCILRLVAATPETKFLEPGIGTGRIALPILQRGYSYTGVDISEKMLDELRHKLGDESSRLTLIQTDATSLPFSDDSFDVALTVHLLHLIPAWREVLAELRRVLKPDGLYLYCHDNAGPSARKNFDQQWETILARYGVKLAKYGAASNEEVIQVLQEQGAQLETVIAAQWQYERTVGELLESYAGRIYSTSWQIPEGVFSAVIQDLKDWSKATYESEEVRLSFDAKFEITVARNWSVV